MGRSAAKHVRIQARAAGARLKTRCISAQRHVLCVMLPDQKPRWQRRSLKEREGVRHRIGQRNHLPATSKRSRPSASRRIDVGQPHFAASPARSANARAKSPCRPQYPHFHPGRTLLRALQTLSINDAVRRHRSFITSYVDATESNTPADTSRFVRLVDFGEAKMRGRRDAYPCGHNRPRHGTAAFDVAWHRGSHLPFELLQVFIPQTGLDWHPARKYSQEKIPLECPSEKNGCTA